MDEALNRHNKQGRRFKGEQAMITLRQTWQDYQQVRKMKPKTLSDHGSKLTRGVGDWLDLDMNTISKSMVLVRHRELSKHPVQANCTMRIVRTLFNFAIANYEDDNEDPLIKRNPVVRLSQMKAWNRERARDRHVPLNKIRPWLDAVLMLHSATIRDYLITLLLTGLRHSECANLQWKYIDLNDQFLFIPDTKNGNSHQLPLSSFLYELLLERRELTKTSDYVFPGGRHGINDGAMRSPYKAIAKVRETTGIPFSPHDLRRTFLAVAEDIGVDEFTRKRLVNHTFQDVTGKHYSIKNPERLREPMQRISSRVLELAELN
jgi:integrase